MSQPNEHLFHARTLRADILASPAVWLPRREVLLQWLDGFLVRAGVPAYDLGDTEAADLKALDQFLRRQHVPAAPK